MVSRRVFFRIKVSFKDFLVILFSFFLSNNLTIIFVQLQEKRLKKSLRYIWNDSCRNLCNYSRKYFWWFHKSNFAQETLWIMFEGVSVENLNKFQRNFWFLRKNFWGIPPVEFLKKKIKNIVEVSEDIFEGI